MYALANGNLIPGVSSRLEAESPNDAGRYDRRSEDRGSPAELLRATRLSRLARPVSDQRHCVALLYTLSRDTTLFGNYLTKVFVASLMGHLGKRK